MPIRNEPQSRTRALSLFQAALIGLATWWVYRPVFHAGWIWDDNLEILDNFSLHSVHGLWCLWFAPPGLDYFPLKSTLQWVQWQLWQGSAGGYHATNVILHFLSALLLWRVLGRLGIRHGWLGGLLFAVHPLAVETVAWISEFKNVLSLTFLLLAFLLWLEADEARASDAENRWSGSSRDAYSDGNSGGVTKRLGTSRSTYATLSLICFAAAMLSKTSVVMFPVVLLLYGWSRLGSAKPRQGRGALGRRYLLATLPFFAVSLVLGVVTLWFQLNRALEKTAAASEGLFARVAVAGKAIVFYFAKAVWPTRELPVYPRWDMAGAGEWGWGAVFVGIVVVLLVGLRVKRLACRSIIFGAGFFVINLLPVVGLAPMAYQQISWVADHFVYLPLVGIVGLAAAGADWILGSEKGGARVRARREGRGLESASTVLIGAAVVVLAVHSHSYARIFQNEKSLWTYTLERNPAAWIGYNNLGIALRTEGHPEEAIRYYEAAIRLRPDFAEAHNDLGVALAEQGKFQGALAQYEAAIRDNPNMADAYNNEGNLLQNMGRLPQAEVQVRQALRLRPDFPEAHNDLGNVLVRRGHTEEAIQQYREALHLRPDFVEAMSNLGMTLATVGKIDEAISLYERALQLRPEYAQAHNNLGVLLARAGRREEAIGQYRLALRYDPNLKEAQANLQSLEVGR